MLCKMSGARKSKLDSRCPKIRSLDSTQDENTTSVPEAHYMLQVMCIGIAVYILLRVSRIRKIRLVHTAKN
jgi:hypothetical protein